MTGLEAAVEKAVHSRGAAGALLVEVAFTMRCMGVLHVPKPSKLRAALKDLEERGQVRRAHEPGSNGNAYRYFAEATP